MKIRLSDHFTYRRLLRFTLPSVITMIVASIYSVVDGLFVSNLVEQWLSYLSGEKQIEIPLLEKSGIFLEKLILILYHKKCNDIT